MVGVCLGEGQMKVGGWEGRYQPDFHLRQDSPGLAQAVDCFGKVVGVCLREGRMKVGGWEGG